MPPALPLLSLLALASGSGIHFIENDPKRAFAEAKRRHLPIFVEAWAPWCHSCLSMRAYVFPDPALAPLADRFVWLSLETERPESASFLERFPVDAWPTLLVLDERGAPRARWLGSLSPRELVRRLRLVSNELEADAGLADVNRQLRSAEAEEAAGRRAEAALTLRTSLAQGPRGEQRARVVEALLQLLQGQSPRECATLGLREVPELPQGERRLNISAIALSCALALTPIDRELVKTAEEGVRDQAMRQDGILVADDQSAMFQILVEARVSLKDAEGARQTAQAWAAFLESAAGKAATPQARAVFDAHRMLAYEAAGTLERAVPMLEQSEHDFPGDYNPPARLADVLLKLNRPEEALTRARHAADLAYGPRALRILLIEVAALRELGRFSDARRILRQAETMVSRLPTGQRQPGAWKALDDARQQLSTRESRK